MLLSSPIFKALSSRPGWLSQPPTDGPLHAPSSAEAAGGLCRELSFPHQPSPLVLLLPQGPSTPPSPGLAAGSPSQCPAPRVPLACCFLLQDHLQHCLFQPVQCSNENCQEPVLRKDLKEHLSAFCRFREEKCIYCKKDVVVINLQVNKKKASLWD